MFCVFSCGNTQGLAHGCVTIELQLKITGYDTERKKYQSILHMSPSTDMRENREFAAEVKFVLDSEMAAQIRNWARKHLLPDPHASGANGDNYGLCSLYFDNDQFDVYRRYGSFGRCKYRIRRYGSNDTVFVERKLKTRGLLAKRRSLVPIKSLALLEASMPQLGWEGKWFHDRIQLRQLHPVCLIAYQRMARYSLCNNRPIRLTIDENIYAAATNEISFNNELVWKGVLENQNILEIKYRIEMPLLFKNLIEEYDLKPQPVSKYRLAIGALGLVKSDESTVSNPALAEESLCLSS